MTLDPFIGSGTTAVAALLHSRKYLVIELKKEYYDEAQRNVDEVKKIMRQKIK
jgi:DNA modification methylase